MSVGDPSGSSSAADGSRFCVLLVCFARVSGASKVRRKVDAAVGQGGGVILDEVVMRVDAKGKARVFDPRRTWAGLLTAALTWGLFGLVTGGWESLGLWAVLGAVAGGGWAYLNEHLLTKDQLARLTTSMPPDSSALAVYLQASDAQQILDRTDSLRPTAASVAAISVDLTAQVYAASADPVPATGGSTRTPTPAAPSNDRLAMILARYAGKAADVPEGTHAKGGNYKGESKKGPLVELVIETDGNGRHRVIDPTTGARTTSRGDVVSWGAFGLVCGAIAGFLGSAGILGAVERGLLTALGWGIFGLVAGALYGLWAGRGVSARRVRRMGPLLPRNTSTVIAWADDTVSAAAITEWGAASSNLLTLWFVPTAGGARLEA